MRSLIWIKAVNKDLLLNDSDWWVTPRHSLVQSYAEQVDWNPPAEGSMKFNVDGAFNLECAGCGGVLRNCNGDVRAMFAGPVEMGAEYAELMAIRLALSIFIEANWVGKTFLLVESDSQVVINWIANMSSRPWRWWNIFEDLDADCRKILKGDPIQSTILAPCPIEQSWIPLPGNMVKFSVDGAATSDKAGCGVVLRDAQRIISIMFYGPLSPLGPDFAELVAILKALEVFKAGNWIGRAPLIVESNSKVILNWLSDSLQRPWRWWKIFRDIGCLVTQIENIQFQHVCMEKNLANYLAKVGLQRSEFFESWWLKVALVLTVWTSLIVNTLYPPPRIREVSLMRFTAHSVFS
ncbi:hypothetical protein GQ457_17G004770 [Hibiscus cannabinus]